MRRRDFIKHTTYSALATGSMGMMGAFASGSDKAAPFKMTVGVHPWIYAAPLPKYDITPELERIFAEVSEVGVAGIELMHHPLRDHTATEQIISLSNQYGLPVIGTSYSAAMWDKKQHKQIIKDAETVISNLARTGGKTLGTSVGDADRDKTSRELDHQAGLLKDIIAICEKHGVVLNLHNHTYEVRNNMHDLKGTLKRIPDVKLGPDLNWLVRGGVNPSDFIREFGPQIIFLHLRNQYSNGRWSEDLSQGDMDFAAIAETLKAVGFKGHGIIELAHERDFTPTRPIKESLKISRAFVKKTFGS